MYIQNRNAASLSLAILLLCGISLVLAGAPMRPGSGWYSSNTDAAALAGGSAHTTVFDSLRNPAALAQNKVLQIGINYSEVGTPADCLTNPDYLGPNPGAFGFFGTSLGFGAGVSLPVGFGVLNFNIGAENDMALSEAYNNDSHGGGFHIKGGFAKAITPWFHFGAGLDAIFSGSISTEFNAAFDIGIMIVQNGLLSERAASHREKGFGLFDRIFSFAFNVGGFTDKNTEYSDTHAIAGFEFLFFKSEPVKFGLNNNAVLAIDQPGLRYSGGLDMLLFDIVHLRGGVHLGTGNEDMGPLALGAGIDFRRIFHGVNLDLSWAMITIPVSRNSTLYETAHFITLNYAFGSDEPVPDITSRLRAFSPNNDGIQDTAIFDIDIFATEDIVKWEIVIKNAGGTVVRSVKSEDAASDSMNVKKFFSTLFASRARIIIPETWEWDGRDNAGRPIPDGTYTYQFVVWDTADDIYSSAGKPVDIRQVNTKPVITLAAAPKLFAPDDSGRGEKILRITLGFRDRAIIANWKVVIKHGDSVFKTFTGKEPEQQSETILWDGIGDAGHLVESAETYTVDASAVDFMNNTGDAPPVSIDVDILVVNTDRGLKIVISSIEFAVGSAELSGQDSPILNRVAEMLRRYPGYRILVEGHTDNTGGSAYNRTLSEQRAQTVLRYLVQRRIEEQRMSVRGFGSSAPAVSNATEEGRARNRRVEFILVKDE
ncbi:MAG: OmpA family protein [Spirochaetota bacterium]|jgi:outer membrane protein OmpA-like peptidoglycan-associated protein|nr:OmpA family protein [Spirochaetota bacterium]